jgi:hypothetical protein
MAKKVNVTSKGGMAVARVGNAPRRALTVPAAKTNKPIYIKHMAGTPNDAQIYNLATENYQGIVEDGEDIGITMVTAPEMLASRDAFKNAGNDVGNKRNALRNAYQVFHPAMLALYKWLLTTRSVIAGRIGDRWSAAWAEAGWPGPSTAVPKTIAGRISLGTSLKSYYTANPTYEVGNMDVTAAKAEELTTAATSTQEGVANAEAGLKAAGDTRDASRTGVLDKMSTLLANLTKKLAKNDPRWLDFGLRMPSIRRTPLAPTGLQATIMGSKFLLDCDATALATRYRFRRKILGVDSRYTLAASSKTPMAMLEGVAAGLTIEFIVQAVNGSAQSVPSDAITVTTPVPPAVAPEIPASSEAELAPLAAIAPNGNGNGHGSLAVNRVN